MSKERKTLNVVGHSKLFYSISCALIAIFIILTFVIGLNVAIEFKGGTVLTYTYEGDIKTSDVSNTVSDSIGDKCTVRRCDLINQEVGIWLQYEMSPGEPGYLQHLYPEF